MELINILGTLPTILPLPALLFAGVILALAIVATAALFRTK